MMLLVVSNNDSVAAFLKFLVEPHGLEVQVTSDREAVKPMLRESGIIAILLDFPQPTYEDFEYWRDLQQHTMLPVLIVSTDNTDAQRILSYLSASMKLALPLTNMFQQFAAAAQDEYGMSYRGQILLGPDVVLDVAGHCIVKRGERTPLSSIEFKLLYLLAANIGCAKTTQELMDQVELSGLSALYVHIKNLRDKLEDDPAHPKILITRRGQGYEICSPASTPSDSLLVKT